MKKLILFAFTLLGMNAAIAQSSTGDNKGTNATGTGHKLEQVTDTVYIPAKDADGSEKHDSITSVKTSKQPSTSNKSKKQPKGSGPVKPEDGVEIK